MVKARVVGLMLLAWCAEAAAKPRQLVVSLERTMCFGDCPAYTVSIYDDGLVQWKGKANVGRKGAARGKADPKQLAGLVDEFVKARFFEMDSTGEIPPPLPPGSARKLSLACKDTSHAITTFRQGKKTRKLDDPHCQGASPLTALEKLVNDVAGSQAFIALPPAAKPAAKLACSEDRDCTMSCQEGAVSGDWYRAWVATHPECKDGCAGKGMSARCVKGGCVAFHSGSRDDSCTARP